MDFSTFVFEKAFGFSPRKAVRFFLARMWIGYAFDAGEFAFTWVYVGMDNMFMSDNWRYWFYGYVGGLGLIAFLITFFLICCIFGGNEEDGRLNWHKKIPYFMGYFKLTAAVNAGVVFFTLYFSKDRNEPLTLAFEILSGIDMGVNLMQMAFGFAGFNFQRLCSKNDEVYPYDEPSTSNSYVPSPRKSSRSSKKVRKSRK